MRALPGSAILRSVVVHGAGAKGNMARLARLARLPLPLPLANLHGRRSIVSDRNLASAVVFALEHRVAGPRHVDDGEPLSLPQMVGLMRQALGRPPAVVAPPFRLDARLVDLLAQGFAPQLLGDLIVSGATLRSEGWQPVEASAEGLARLVSDQTRR
jgi:nucleoside-diphosphate-sugar epimerase